MIDATTAAALQIAAAVTVGGIAAAVIVYVTGLDRVLRHPVIHFELFLAMGMSLLPAKRRKPGIRKHYQGRRRVK